MFRCCPGLPVIENKAEYLMLNDIPHYSEFMANSIYIAIVILVD
jgi:hypothetical protein